jgi:hypothetical protein
VIAESVAEGRRDRCLGEHAFWLRLTEWPDVATAVRALAAAGPSVPAIRAVGYEEFCGSLAEVIGPLHADGLGVRITSEFCWVTARPV